MWLLELAILRPLRISSGWSISAISSPPLEDRHPRPAVDHRIGDSERRENAEMGGTDLGAGEKHGRPARNILSGPADVLARLRRPADRDAVAALVGVLLSHHRIGATGTGAPVKMRAEVPDSIELVGSGRPGSARRRGAARELRESRPWYRGSAPRSRPSPNCPTPGD